jgi:hypothetical protein
MPLDNGPVDYRQLQAPVSPLTPGELPDTGKAQEAEALAGLFRSFSGVTNELGTQVQQTTGKRQGEAAGASGAPSLKTGIAQYTAFGQAYNNAATGAFLTESEIHAEDTAAKLRVQANNDPAAFEKIYGAAADAAVKEAPAQVQGAMRDLYNRHLAAGVLALSGEQAFQIQQTQKAVYDEGTERGITRVAILQGSPNAADQAAAVDEHAKLIARVMGGVAAGLYSPAEADAKLVNATRAITAQVFSTNVDRALADMAAGKGSTGVVDLLENFRKAHEQNLADTTQAPILSEDEYQRLMQGAKQKLQQENIIEAYSRKDSKSAEQLKFEAGDRTITVAMSTPDASPAILRQMVQDMVHTEDLKPEVGRAVLNSLQRGNDAPPNKRGLFDALNDPTRFDWKPEDIARKIATGQVNVTQALELQRTIETQRQGWEGHAAIKDAHATLNDKLKLPSGIALETASDEQKKAAADAGVEFTKQMNAIPLDKRDGEAPRVANNVVLEMQAKAAEADAAARAASQARVEKNYGPGGVNYQSDADLKFRLDKLQQAIKDDQAKADQLRKGIKN